MATVLLVVLYVAVAVASVFMADAVLGFVRRARGVDDDAVNRRIDEAVIESDGPSRAETLMRSPESIAGWTRGLPFSAHLVELVRQSGLKVRADRVLLLIGLLFLATLLGLLLILPRGFSWLSLVGASICGFGPVLGYLNHARMKRRRTFDEQLPDALDLIVRSLKIGHPFGGAMQVIADHMAPPISEEFAIACAQVTYGRDVTSTLNEMKERVGASDLGYVAVAVQIQQESGGNLVESLTKLSNVIRDRFRMFRKARAVTAEGRFSAWALSLFPLLIAVAIQLVKPDYYTQVMNYRYFPYFVALVVVLLVINVIAMRILTTLKV